jgi:hypothetical protein
MERAASHFGWSCEKHAAFSVILGVKTMSAILPRHYPPILVILACVTLDGEMILCGNSRCDGVRDPRKWWFVSERLLAKFGREGLPISG